MISIKYDTKNNTMIRRMTPSPQTSSIYLPFVPNLRLFVEEIEHAFVDGWDGAGALALCQATLVRADRLISLYGSTQHIAEVSVAEDGSLSIIWDDYIGNYAYLGVGPGDTIHVFYSLVDGRKWEGVSLFSDPTIMRQLAIGLQFLHPSSPKIGPYRDNQSRPIIRFAAVA